MAVYRIFPEQDAFIFSEVPTNAGLDEIVEIGGYTRYLQEKEKQVEY
jgi:hypothetical protein